MPLLSDEGKDARIVHNDVTSYQSRVIYKLILDAALHFIPFAMLHWVSILHQETFTITITITIRYLYSAPYRVGQRR